MAKFEAKTEVTGVVALIETKFSDRIARATRYCSSSR